jgi:hypothetical protein
MIYESQLLRNMCEVNSNVDFTIINLHVIIYILTPRQFTQIITMQLVQKHNGFLRAGVWTSSVPRDPTFCLSSQFRF